jgi:hypothetical protein
VTFANLAGNLWPYFGIKNVDLGICDWPPYRDYVIAKRKLLGCGPDSGFSGSIDIPSLLERRVLHHHLPRLP